MRLDCASLKRTVQTYQHRHILLTFASGRRRVGIDHKYYFAALRRLLEFGDLAVRMHLDPCSHCLSSEKLLTRISLQGIRSKQVLGLDG